MTIIERVEEILASKGMKKKAAYEAAGVSASTYSTWVAANVTSIPSEYVPPLAKLLDITCDELLTGETKIIADKNTSRLLEIYNSLTFDGQQLVLAKAVEEKRYEQREGRR